MPIYLFENPNKDGDIVEVVQSMNDIHEYEVDGVKWKRVFTKPNYAIDSVKIDPFSNKDFIKATNKKGTVGELLDRSKEMSEMRKEKAGIDPIKEQVYDEYKKATGKEHMKQKQEKAQEAVKHIADLEF